MDFFLEAVGYYKEKSPKNKEFLSRGCNIQYTKILYQ